MLTYTFEERGKTPYYKYLYEKMKEDILSSRMKPGTRLPSKRSFARNLNLSIMTVENAYAQLQVEGYIYSVEKKGYYVSDISPRTGFAPMNPGLSHPQPGYRVSIKKIYRTDDPAAFPSEDVDTCLEDAPFADFTSNLISRERFPFATWSNLVRRVLSKPDDALLQSSHPQGIYLLRAAIGEHLYHFRGMLVHPDQIVVGAGTEYLYSLLIQLLGRDKIYGVENPGYKKISRIYASNDVRFCPIDLDGQGLCLKALQESGADNLHISPSHHFPTGIVMPVSRRQELLSWAAEKPGRYILEDDYDSEFRFVGLPIPSLQSIDTDGRVIYLNTFSKSLTPSIRISYMVLPRGLLKEYQERLNFYSCTVSNFEQYTLAAFLSEGYFEKHINRMRNYYRSKRDRMIEAIKESPLSRIAKIREENSGLHFLLHIKTSLTDSEVISRAKETGIRLSCLSDYSYDENPAYVHTFIINYSGISPDRMGEAVRRLYHAISSVSKLA